MNTHKIEDTTTDVVKGRIVTYSFTDIDAVEKAGNGKKKPTRYIKGLANANTVDRVGDRVDPSAFVKAREKYMQLPMVFYNHDWSTPIGKVVEYNPSERGLEVEIELGYDFEPAETVWKMIQQGLLKAFSVGFRPKTIEHDVETDVYNITDLELLEVSVVTIPMNAESLFEVSKDGSLKSITMSDTSGNWVTYKDYVKGLENSTKTAPEAPTVPVAACTYVTKNAVECTTCKKEAICIVDSINAFSKENPICGKCFVDKYSDTFLKGVLTEEANEQVDENISAEGAEKTVSDEAMEEATSKLEEASATITELVARVAELEQKVIDTTSQLNEYKIAVETSDVIVDLVKSIENFIE